LKEALENWLNGGSDESKDDTTNESTADTVANETKTEKVDDVGQAFDNLFN
jgi:hypothetical protein